MIQVKDFFLSLNIQGFSFYTGVPDSLLKSFCKYVDDNVSPSHHIIAANEGNAIGIASGFHLATNQFPVVYLQNSGLGNCINPLTSLTDKDVYSIPMLLIIGWRGEPGMKDEPQHLSQGRITPDLLNVLGIQFLILDADSDAVSIAKEAKELIKLHNSPVAILVKKNTFFEYGKTRISSSGSLKREAALEAILSAGKKDAIYLSTTGKLSRELNEVRFRRGEDNSDFLSVGSMGHTSSIALGVALSSPSKDVICLDGDGALLMHMGALPIIGSMKPKNFLYVLFNNGAHESVGGQPTIADQIDFKQLSSTSLFEGYSLVTSLTDISENWNKIITLPRPHFVEIKIALGSRADLGRPGKTPLENKNSFMKLFS
jgi:phosphonopyruvate decarboxylase